MVPNQYVTLKKKTSKHAHDGMLLELESSRENSTHLFSATNITQWIKIMQPKPTSAMLLSYKKDLPVVNNS